MNYTVKQLLEVSRGEHSGYYIAGHVDTHGGQEDAGTKEFKVKYADYPSTSDIKKQNPHLKDHDVEAIMKHVDHANQQDDSDYSNTSSEQKAGGKTHDVYIHTNKPVFKAKNEAVSDETKNLIDIAEKASAAANNGRSHREAAEHWAHVRYSIISSKSPEYKHAQDKENFHHRAANKREDSEQIDEMVSDKAKYEHLSDTAYQLSAEKKHKEAALAHLTAVKYCNNFADIKDHLSKVESHLRKI